MKSFQAAALQTVFCCAAAGVFAPADLIAAPQEQPGAAATSVTRIKQRLERPVSRSFTPAVPVQLRPTFRSRTDQRAFVPTLEEDLHKTFALTDFQRQYAEYASRSGLDLGFIFRRIDKALEERQIRKTREQIARELAELQAARK